jgi:phosphinothricin acetyltransferase
MVAGITLLNPASVALNESVGYRQLGPLERVGFKEGAWWDVGLWQHHAPLAAAYVPSRPAPVAEVSHLLD